MHSDPLLNQDEIPGIVRAAAEGDPEALTRLLCAHHARLFGLAKRKIGVDWQGKIEAEDVLQETYAEIGQHIATFTADGEDAFFRWSARILDRRFIDQVRGLRRKRRDVSREVRGGANSSRYETLVERCLPDHATASKMLRRQDAVAAVLACLAGMTPEHRELVERIHLRGEAVADVARDVGKSEDAVRRMAGRALAELTTKVGRASRYLSRGS